MNEHPIIAIWQKHSHYMDRGYESIEAKRFSNFIEAEQHLQKNLNSDFKCFIAIESNVPIYLNSDAAESWQSLSQSLIPEDYLEKLKNVVQKSDGSFSSCFSN